MILYLLLNLKLKIKWKFICTQDHDRGGGGENRLMFCTANKFSAAIFNPGTNHF